MRPSITKTRLALASLIALAAALPARAEDFDLNALIEAARAEPPITVYDSTGKIKDMAESFSAAYGIQATGEKVAATVQLEMIIREAQAGNIVGDVVMISDTPAAVAQLLPEGFVQSWLPPDMAGVIPAVYQTPLTATTNANVFAYNTEVNKTCPVSNIWALTQPEWRGLFAMTDPLLKASYTDWFNQMERHDDEAVRQAYQDFFGKPLETEFDSATKAWVAALAANAPRLAENDDPVSAAVGAPGQSTPFLGLMSSAKFRDIADKGYKMAVCDTMQPFVGWTYNKLALIAANTDSPNAARLFVHYVLTEEGIMPQMKDGKVPTNTSITLPADEPSGLMTYRDRLLPYDAATGLEDWHTRQDWQDFWRVNYQR